MIVVGSSIVSVALVHALSSAPAGVAGTFCERELADAASRPRPVLSLAARLAAKRAFAAAIGAWLERDLTHADVWVESEPNGAPRLAFSAPVVEQLAARGVDRVHVSLAHAGEYASALVVASRRRRETAQPPSTQETSRCTRPPSSTES